MLFPIVNVGLGTYAALGLDEMFHNGKTCRQNGIFVIIVWIYYYRVISRNGAFRFIVRKFQCEMIVREICTDGAFMLQVAAGISVDVLRLRQVGRGPIPVAMYYFVAVCVEGFGQIVEGEGDFVRTSQFYDRQQRVPGFVPYPYGADIIVECPCFVHFRGRSYCRKEQYRQ